MKKLVALIAVGTLAACGPELELKLDGAQDAAYSIFYGSAPDQPYHQAVVALHKQDARNIYGYHCSGTLIAPDVVLTAAHCLDISTNARKGFKTMAPSSLLIYFGDGPLTQAEVPNLRPVVQTLIHLDYNPMALRNDLALIRLSAAEASVAPVPALPASLGFTSADIGGAINFAGFGKTENGSSGIKLQVDHVLGGLGCSVAGCPSAGDAATQISYDQTVGPCSGDSGGPAFIARAGQTYVGGMTSYGDSACTVYGVSTRADAYESWIQDFVSPAPPPPPPPPGACGNGVCDPGEDCNSCRSDCPKVGKGKNAVCTAG
ncbi:MAG: trypsin-like serine protease [Pseudomonadota bacterium]